ADEDRQAHPPDPWERIRRRRGHAYQRMGLTIGPRRDGDVGELVELPRVAEGLALPRRENDVERLEEACLALLVGHAERVVRSRAAAAADAEVEAALTELVERGDLA